MNSHSQHPEGQFLSIESAAELLQITPADLRRAMACGLIPIRRDNRGAIRVHRDELPNDLLLQINDSDMDPQLLFAVYEDELVTLRDKLGQSESLRTQLEHLLTRQGEVIERSNAILQQRQSESQRLEFKLDELNAKLVKSEGESQRLTTLLERTFAAIQSREDAIVAETGQLTGATDKAMRMLDRAIDQSEKVGAVADDASPSASASSHERLEREIDQRNAMIDQQQQLMERLVSLSEQQTMAKGAGITAANRSLWQRLWDRFRGIPKQSANPATDTGQATGSSTRNGI